MRSWMEDIFFQCVHSGSPWSCLTFVLFTFSLNHSAPALSSTISHDRTQASELLYIFGPKCTEEDSLGTVQIILAYLSLLGCEFNITFEEEFHINVITTTATITTTTVITI
ncbi:uncharacterized protein C8R40DRAFT_512068 [Lentinula edodes]|uniref:uncharacterized protein n=1 Tax=Lentinula edodes TaxID=5353 RepID=UPI001E8D7EDD|nr:uncharacterized protein C8R40DRAFT_512068 [Lentinula edodes]KAH7871904.1 hypothetical protein C8R40DRAFT_512068 [Lentinula edodes]